MPLSRPLFLPFLGKWTRLSFPTIPNFPIFSLYLRPIRDYIWQKSLRIFQPSAPKREIERIGWIVFGSFLRNRKKAAFLFPCPLAARKDGSTLTARASIHVIYRGQTSLNSHRYCNDNSISTRRILIVAFLVLDVGSFLPRGYIQVYISLRFEYDPQRNSSTGRQYVESFVAGFVALSIFFRLVPQLFRKVGICIRRACIRIERASSRIRRFQSRFYRGYCRLARLPYTRPYIFPNHFEPILAPPPVPYQNFPVSADTKTVQGG